MSNLQTDKFMEYMQEIKIDNDIRNAQAENDELQDWIFKNYDYFAEYDLRQAMAELAY